MSHDATPAASGHTPPMGVDIAQPSAARMYDYYLGGAHNFEADRVTAEQILAVYPQAPQAAQANRAFLRRTVQYLVGEGVRQFLDVGSGIPTVGHVHEVAQAGAPDARVVYVDIDPVAVAHSREILAGNTRTAAIQHDVRQPDRILADPEVRRLFDFDEPIAVLIVALLHFVTDDDDPRGIITRLMRPLAPGSHLVLSHATGDGKLDMARGKEIYQRAGIDSAARSRDEVAALLADYELVEPGLVWIPLWRPERSDDLYHDDPEQSGIYGAVARKG